MNPLIPTKNLTNPTYSPDDTLTPREDIQGISDEVIHYINDVMTVEINGKSAIGHNHDSAYSSITHNHNSSYSPLGHNHNSAYSSLTHTHDLSYSPLGHAHDLSYSPISHNHNSDYATKSHHHDSSYSLISHHHNLDYSPITHHHDSAYAQYNHDHNSSYSPLGHNHDDAYASVTHNHNDAYASITHNHAQDYISKERNIIRYKRAIIPASTGVSGAVSATGVGTNQISLRAFSLQVDGKSYFYEEMTYFNNTEGSHSFLYFDKETKTIVYDCQDIIGSPYPSYPFPEDAYFIMIARWQNDVSNASGNITNFLTWSFGEDPLFEGDIDTADQIAEYTMNTKPVNMNRIEDKSIASSKIADTSLSAAKMSSSFYQQSTWTPSLGSSDTAPAWIYTAQSGRYVRIGKLFLLDGYIKATSPSSNLGLGNVRLTGLPAILGSSGSASYIANCKVDCLSYAAFGDSSGIMEIEIYPNASYSTGFDIKKRTGLTATTNIVYPAVASSDFEIKFTILGYIT